MSTVSPSAAAGTDPGHRCPPATPTELPAVERRAAIPAGFSAGATAAGIKASGRPDLAVVLVDGEAAAAAAGLHAERLRRGPRAPVAGPPRGDVSPVGDGRSGWARAVIATSGSANAATGAAGDADQLEVAELPRDGGGRPG